MNCIANKKKFLFINYLGQHRYKITSIYKFMECSDTFITESKCELCGAKKTEHFVAWDELLNNRISNEIIQRAMDGETIGFNELKEGKV